MHITAIRALLFILLTFPSYFWSSASCAQQISQLFENQEKLKIQLSMDYFFNQTAPVHTKDVLFLLESDQPTQWFEKRVNYIIPNTESLKTSLSKEDYSYPYPLKVNLQKFNFIEETQISMALMSNVGAELYVQGKKKNKLLSVDLSSHFSQLDNLSITSPRVGLVSISSQYFSKEFNISETGLGEADHISMLAFLSHEARHSDGHDKELGFPHTLCPESSDYSGLKVCDQSYNGAYGVSAAILLELTQECRDCSEIDTEVLKLMYFDFKQRIINDNAMTVERKNQINDLQNELDHYYEKRYFAVRNSQNWNDKLALYEKIIFGLEQKIKILQNTDLLNHTYWESSPEEIFFVELDSKDE